MTLIRSIAVAVSAAVLTLAGIFAGTAVAKPVTGDVAVDITVDCGTVTFTFTNTTSFLFAATYDAGDGRQADISIDGRVGGDTLDTKSVTLEYGEDTGAFTALLGVFKGAEQDNYPATVEADVATDCEPPAPTTTTAPPASTTTPPDTSTPDTSDPTTTEDSTPPATSVTSSTAGVHYDNCDEVRAAGNAPLLADQPGYRSGLDSDSDGEGCEQTDVQLTGGDSDLAYTGTAPGLYVALGVLLLAAGGGVLLLARRRAGR